MLPIVLPVEVLTYLEHVHPLSAPVSILDFTLWNLVNTWTSLSVSWWQDKKKSGWTLQRQHASNRVKHASARATRPHLISKPSPSSALLSSLFVYRSLLMTTTRRITPRWQCIQCCRLTAQPLGLDHVPWLRGRSQGGGRQQQRSGAVPGRGSGSLFDLSHFHLSLPPITVLACTPSASSSY
jgi:hypothetical protein